MKWALAALAHLVPLPSSGSHVHPFWESTSLILSTFHIELTPFSLPRGGHVLQAWPVS